MTYAVHVDNEPPADSPELDPLQREGVAALLDRRLPRRVHSSSALPLRTTSPQVVEYVRTADGWRDNPMNGIVLNR